MKKGLIIGIIVLSLVIVVSGYFVFRTSGCCMPNVEINKFQEEDASKSIITYSILDELEDPECILNVKRGTQEKLEFPLSCPGAVSPKGSHICNAQSHSAVLGKNQLEVWKTVVDLTEAKSIEICCINSDIPISSPEDLDLTKEDFICSKSYKI